MNILHIVISSSSFSCFVRCVTQNPGGNVLRPSLNANIMNKGKILFKTGVEVVKSGKWNFSTRQ